MVESDVLDHSIDSAESVTMHRNCYDEADDE